MNSTGPQRVLVVDDDPEILSTLLSLLRTTGFDTEGASTGRTALTMLQEHRFDFLLLDVVLPDIDGLEVLRRIRGSSRKPEILVMSSGGTLDGMDYLRMAQDLGADHVLEKPFPPKTLMKLLRREEQDRPAT